MALRLGCRESYGVSKEPRINHDEARSSIDDCDRDRDIVLAKLLSSRTTTRKAQHATTARKKLSEARAQQPTGHSGQRQHVDHRKLGDHHRKHGNHRQHWDRGRARGGVTWGPPPPKERTRPGEGIPTGQQHVVVLVGMPGAGKSYTSNMLLGFAKETASSTSGWSHVNQDSDGSRKNCEAKARQALSRGANVIVDRCNFDESQRAPWVKLAVARGGVCISAVCLDVKKSVCQDRVQTRVGHSTLFGDPDHTNAIVAKVGHDLTRPQRAEGFNRIVWTSKDGELETELQALACANTKDSELETE